MRTHHKIARVFRECQKASNRTPGYSYGGGHGEALSKLEYSQRLDCSSSSSLVLFNAGLWKERDWAFSSGDFAQWGVEGEGKYMTVWYRKGHVYIVFHGLKRGYRRFDTSPWGFGGTGPRLRKTRRPNTGCKPRHWPGL